MDTQTLLNDAKSSSEIVHARIAAIRKHAMQALARSFCFGGQCLKADRRVYQITQYQPGCFVLSTESTATAITTQAIYRSCAGS
jgi:predicted proteasome-type protease